MAKLVSRRRLQLGHCHGFRWLRGQREGRRENVEAGLCSTRRTIDGAFMEQRDYDATGQLIALRHYRRVDWRSEPLVWHWELIEGRVYDADGKWLATFCKESTFGSLERHVTYVYYKCARLSSVS